jgi:hypothetical protein
MTWSDTGEAGGGGEKVGSGWWMEGGTVKGQMLLKVGLVVGQEVQVAI